MFGGGKADANGIAVLASDNDFPFDQGLVPVIQFKFQKQFLAHFELARQVGFKTQPRAGQIHYGYPSLGFHAFFKGRVGADKGDSLADLFSPFQKNRVLMTAGAFAFDLDTGLVDIFKLRNIHEFGFVALGTGKGGLAILGHVSSGKIAVIHINSLRCGWVLFLII